MWLMWSMAVMLLILLVSFDLLMVWLMVLTYFVSFYVFW